MPRCRRAPISCCSREEWWGFGRRRRWAPLQSRSTCTLVTSCRSHSTSKTTCWNTMCTGHKVQTCDIHEVADIVRTIFTFGWQTEWTVQQADENWQTNTNNLGSKIRTQQQLLQKLLTFCFGKYINIIAVLYHHSKESNDCCKVVSYVEDFAYLVPVLEQDDRIGDHVAANQSCVGSDEPRVTPSGILRNFLIVQNAVHTYCWRQRSVDRRVDSTKC